MLVFVCSVQLFAQDNSKTSLSISLVRWQSDSPVQVVGAGFGKNTVIEEVFLFNSSNTTVNRIRLAGLVFVPEKHLSKDINDFSVFESKVLEVSIPPLEVVRLNNVTVLSPSDVAKFREKLKSADIVIRLGVSASGSTNGKSYNSKLNQRKLFNRANVGDAEYDRIDESWTNYGYKKMIEVTQKDLAVSFNLKCSLEDDSNCSKNQFDYDTSWCQRTSQNQCRTFQCNNIQFCPRDSCRKIMDEDVIS